MDLEVKINEGIRCVHVYKCPLLTVILICITRNKMHSEVKTKDYSHCLLISLLLFFFSVSKEMLLICLFCPTNRLKIFSVLPYYA